MTPATLADLLPVAAIRIDDDSPDWRTAVLRAGGLLVQTGAAEPAYATAMVAALERFGPYVVIAPGLALAHAQTSDGVNRAGLSLVRLRTPVAFGHATNDPVGLVVGLCSLDHESHLSALQHLAGALVYPERRERLATAPTPATLRDVLLTPNPRRTQS